MTKGGILFQLQSLYLSLAVKPINSCWHSNVLNAVNHRRRTLVDGGRGYESNGSHRQGEDFFFRLAPDSAAANRSSIVLSSFFLEGFLVLCYFCAHFRGHTVRQAVPYAYWLRWCTVCLWILLETCGGYKEDKSSEQNKLNQRIRSAVVRVLVLYLV